MKKAKRLDELEKKVKARGDDLPQLRQIYRESSQLSMKFYRWLRSTTTIRLRGRKPRAD